MLFTPYSKFLNSILPKFGSKSELATKLGLERRKLDSLLAVPYGAISYDEGKSVEHFSRAHLAAQPAHNCESLRFVISGSFPNAHSDLKDHFAIGFWPEQNLMIAKATGGPKEAVLPDRDTENRAMFAVQTLEKAGIQPDLSQINFYEIQRLKDLYYPTQIRGLTNTMTNRVAQYNELLSPERQIEILLLANQF